MKKRILIVEDNQINRKMLSRIVTSKYEAEEAENGREALEILEKHADQITLILLDLVMPVMNGYEFLKEKQKNPSFASIPVIVTTEYNTGKEEKKALEWGAMEFVVKPYQPQLIMHRIENLLRMQEETALVYQLQYDRLTGLYSKDYFYRCAREEKTKHPDRIYDFVCVNVESFHLFNDRYGVEQGDRLLRTIAELFRKQLPADCAASRLYADRFIFMLEHREHMPEAVFERIREAVLEEFKQFHVKLKCGIYTEDGSPLSIEKMCDNASLAVRAAKEQYGVDFGRYDGRLKEKLIYEKWIADEMETALEEEQFEVWLQPKVRAGRSDWKSAEALVRWRHPQKGMIYPDQFIPVFEKTSFISKVDRYVWKKTCELMHRWEMQGLGRIQVSVNMSRADLADVGVKEYLEGLVKEYELLPSQLHLEITETACTENMEEALQLLSLLRSTGFIIEMDDFGSGYSSINMLMQMPLDVLKLDRILIQNEFKKKGGLRFIIGLAHWMNLLVVAEGVETKEQMEYMLSLGCDYIQGYYMARPMPWNNFETHLQEQNRRA